MKLWFLRPDKKVHDGLQTLTQKLLLTWEWAKGALKFGLPKDPSMTSFIPTAYRPTPLEFIFDWTPKFTLLSFFLAADHLLTRPFFFSIWCLKRARYTFGIFSYPWWMTWPQPLKAFLQNKNMECYNLLRPFLLLYNIPHRVWFNNLN